MRLKRSATVVGSMLLVGGFGTAAFATAGSLSTSIIPANGNTAQRTITVNFSDVPVNEIVFIQQCKANDSGPFNNGNDCSGATGINPQANASGAGSAQFLIFSGDDPNESGWSCGPGSTAIPSSGTVYNTCYVRITPTVQTNTDTDKFLPITFSTGSPAVPEVPLNILLPLSAAAVLGGGYIVTRKRKLSAAA